MKAGFERHDLKAYMLVWAADGQLARARTEKRDPYEVKMRRDEIERTKQVWFVGPAGNTKLSFDDVEVTFEQGHAKLRWTLTATVTGEDGKSVVDKSGEMYLLRKVGTAWRITRNRVWPIETKRGDEVVRYDAATWDKLDAAVEAAKQSNDQRRLAASLADAYRFAEAHAAAKALTEKPGATKADWTWRMQMAALAGEGQDALAAMARSQGDPGDGTVGARGDARRSP
jgi:hypothetical protein